MCIRMPWLHESKIFTLQSKQKKMPLFKSGLCKVQRILLFILSLKLELDAVLDNLFRGLDLDLSALITKKTVGKLIQMHPRRELISHLSHVTSKPVFAIC